MNTVVQGMTSILEWLFNLSSMIGLPYYGVAIILFTVIIKLLLYPLTWKQMTSMRSITELQPKIQELQKKYANNKQMLNQKIMELYGAEKVNPYSGCLPILIQLPILWAFYRTLYSFPYGNDDSAWFLGFKITESYGFALDYHLLLPILAGITTYISTKVSMATSPNKNKDKKGKQGGAATAEQTQKMMLITMPFFMVYIVATLPSGLGIYILTMNFVSMLQTVYINKKLSAQIARKQEQAKLNAQNTILAEEKDDQLDETMKKSTLPKNQNKNKNKNKKENQDNNKPPESDKSKKLVVDRKLVAEKKKKIAADKKK